MLKTKWESVIFTAYKFFDSKELPSAAGFLSSPSSHKAML